MSDEVRNRGCGEYSDQLAELTLGALTGRQRAQTLSHLESCQRCADEVEQLSRVADAVVQVAPEIEPPMGFETRLFERMGVADARPRRRFRPARWVPAAVAAAAAVAALGWGLSLTPSPAPTISAQATHPTQVSAALVQGRETVGHVMIFGSDKPWISMMLADSIANGTVTCEVVTTDGVIHRVGTFVAHKGYGAWIAPLHGVNPADVHTARVVSPSGTVLATAMLG